MAECVLQVRESTVALLSSLIGQSPVLLAMLIAAVAAVVRWRRHPGISALVLSAALIAALTLLTGMFISAVLSPVMFTWEPVAIAWVTTIIGLVTSTLYAVVWGLLLAAAFGWRSDLESVTECG
jgi:hypothetical protein